MAAWRWRNSWPISGRFTGQYLALVVTLFKLRIVALLLLAALAGAAQVWPGPAGTSLTPDPGARVAWLLLTGALAASGASALNQYRERELDRLMARTRQRPLPLQAMRRPRRVLWTGLGLILTGVGLAYQVAPALALTVAAGAFIYVVVYTIWLKPRTAWNIVIGGAAGSCAVLSGGAALGRLWDPGVWLLALLLFAWTPLHFWSLALAYRDEYGAAGFPMLPVRVTAARAAGWIAGHAILCLLLTLALGIWPRVNPALLGLSPVALAPLAVATIALWREPGRRTALRLFHRSNLFLLLLLLAVIVVRWVA